MVNKPHTSASLTSNSVVLNLPECGDLSKARRQKKKDDIPIPNLYGTAEAVSTQGSHQPKKRSHSSSVSSSMKNKSMGLCNESKILTAL
jgi:hypothetical protein